MDKAQRKRFTVAATSIQELTEQIISMAGLTPDDTILEIYHSGLGIFQPLTDAPPSGLKITDLPSQLRVTARPSSTSKKPQHTSLLSLPWRQFNVDLEHGGFVIGGRPVRVKGVENSGQGTGHTTWDGAVVLAKYLDYQENHLDRRVIRGRRMLETGAGTGLVGLSAAMLGAARVLLTDLPYTLDNLRGNVEMNHDALAGTNSLIEVTALDWFNVTDVGPLDLILAADVVWLNELISPFVSALKTLTEGDNRQAVILLSYQSRSTMTDELLLRTFQASDFQVEKLPPSEYHPDFFSDKITIFRIHRTR